MYEHIEIGSGLVAEVGEWHYIVDSVIEGIVHLKCWEDHTMYTKTEAEVRAMCEDGTAIVVWPPSLRLENMI